MDHIPLYGPSMSRTADLSIFSSPFIGELKKLHTWRMYLDRASFVAHYARSIELNKDDISLMKSNDRLKHNMILMAIVHYAMVFEKTKPLSKIFSEQDIAWHKKIMMLRNKFAAHDEGLYISWLPIGVFVAGDKCLNIQIININETIQCLFPKIEQALIDNSQKASKFFSDKMETLCKNISTEINQLPRKDRKVIRRNEVKLETENQKFELRYF